MTAQLAGSDSDISTILRSDADKTAQTDTAEIFVLSREPHAVKPPVPVAKTG
jgi:hypothetical protein